MITQEAIPPDLARFFGALAAPVWVATLAAVAIATTRTVVWVKGQNGHSKTNGSSVGTWQVSITQALTGLAGAMTALEKQGDINADKLTLMWAELTEIRRVVDRTELKGEQLACREDLAEMVEKSRAMIREEFHAASLREVTR